MSSSHNHYKRRLCHSREGIYVLIMAVNKEFFSNNLKTKSLYDRTLDYMYQYQRLPLGVRLEEANGLEIMNCFHSCYLCKLGNDLPYGPFRVIKFVFCPICSRVTISSSNIAGIDSEIALHRNIFGLITGCVCITRFSGLRVHCAGIKPRKRFGLYIHL